MTPAWRQRLLQLGVLVANIGGTIAVGLAVTPHVVTATHGYAFLLGALVWWTVCIWTGVWVDDRFEKSKENA
jgi:hypothetical protein